MSFIAWLHKFLTPGDAASKAPHSHGALPRLGEDGAKAVAGLARLLLYPGSARTGSHDPLVTKKSVELALSLGNLYRAQGDIEQAVAVRESVLHLPGVAEGQQAEICFELACDYRKAGLLDRAHEAYADALRLGFSQQAVSAELAQLHADSGDFTAAAHAAAKLGLPHAEAFYLVRQAEESSGLDDAGAKHLLQRALAVFPASPEAWRAITAMRLVSGDGTKAAEGAATCLEKGTPSERLIFLEGAYAFTKGSAAPGISAASLAAFGGGLAHRMEQRTPDAVLCYYTGMFQLLAGKDAEAELWFSKTLVLDANFWAARLALLAIAAARDPLPPLVAHQIAFFTQLGEGVKRFVCPPCGMRTDTVFSQCPRCFSWHSVAFRLQLQ